LLNQGTIYASLVRLQQRGWIDADWGTSDNNRKAKFYELTAAGRKRFREETEGWNRLAAAMTTALGAQAEEV
jgi:DNA-binding PadR family transcriptional regulator